MVTKVLARKRDREREGKPKLCTIACPCNTRVTLALTMGEGVK